MDPNWEFCLENLATLARVIIDSSSCGGQAATTKNVSSSEFPTREPQLSSNGSQKKAGIHHSRHNSRQNQGCQIFLGTKYQNGKKYAKLQQIIPNVHKI
jgi:hypothetical protein